MDGKNAAYWLFGSSTSCASVNQNYHNRSFGMYTFKIEISPRGLGAVGYGLRNMPNVEVHRDHLLFKLATPEYQRLQESINQKWVHTTKYLKDDVVTTAYYIWCISTETPYVRVTKLTPRKYRCELDTYTTSYNLTGKGLQEIERLFKQDGNFRGKRRGEAWYDIGDWSVCEHIPAEKAPSVANALLEIAKANRQPI
jgi:hypothetical protein